MKYYIDTIEQVKGEGGAVNEYGKREVQPTATTMEEALPAFYTKCTNVSNDIGEGKNHYYADIQISDSTGGSLKREVIGKRVEA